MTRKPSILLVEDSRVQAVNLRHAFQCQGWEVVWAATVEAAMEELNAAAPDLIVLDYFLPGGSGDELCRRVRMSTHRRNVPILMLTTDQTHDAELRGLASGADYFISKSADVEPLLARIRMLLAKSTMPSAGPMPADHRFRRARVLTIDDSVTYQQYLAAELEQEGYLVEKATSAATGLARLGEEPFDCTLVDLVMPDMTGIEVCRQINLMRRGADCSTAVLMLTGRENKEDLTQALEAGADDFVGKSSDMAVLKGRIRALLRRKFCEEDTRQVAAELQRKELELVRVRADKELADARAALNEKLELMVEERTAQLAQANRNLAQQTQENEMFVYSVSHDLRSPLVNLQGFSQELRRACDDLKAHLDRAELPPALRQHLDQIFDDDFRCSINFIQTAVVRLSDIIDALLRLSRAGRVEYRPQRVMLDEIVHRVIESMASVSSAKGASIRAGELPPVYADRLAVEQVFANLIGNALNYLDPARRGLIEVGSLEAKTEEDGSGSPKLRTYYVKDNGLGIPTSAQSNVFQAFKRFHPEAAAGEGIGLSIVRRVIERHGGRIWLESTPGRGTTFFFTLPTEMPPELVAAENAPADFTPENLEVMVGLGQQ